MAIDDRVTLIIEAERRTLEAAARAEELFSGGGGGGMSGGMEPRIAKLEADMEHAKRDIGELRTDVQGIRVDVATIQVNVATLIERTSHMPNKAEVKKDVDDAIDRLGVRVQRLVTVAGVIITLILSCVTIGLKFFGK